MMTIAETLIGLGFALGLLGVATAYHHGPASALFLVGAAAFIFTGTLIAILG